MQLPIIIGLIVLLLVIMYVRRYKRAFHFYDIILPLFCITFILALVIFPNVSLSSALKGINLWFNIVFPSLFPFFVASELINSTGFVRATGRLLEPIMRPLFNVPGCGSFAFLMGVTSGYPVGARITCNLLESGDISKNEAERLLAFTNNSGPLFIIGAVATGMYGIPSIGFLLLACHIAASMTVGFIFRKKGQAVKSKPEMKKAVLGTKPANIPASRQSNSNLGTMFGDAIKNSIYLVINIGAFIIFFSVVINLLIKTGVIEFFSGILAFIFSPFGIGTDIFSSILSGLFEITTGTDLASKLSNISTGTQLVVTSFIIGWAGLSVHSQVYSIIGKTGISLKPYILGKFLQGLIAAIYTFIFLQLDLIKSLVNQPVLSSVQMFSNIKWQDVLLTSGKYLVFILLIYVLFWFVSLVSKRFKRNKK